MLNIHCKSDVRSFLIKIVLFFSNYLIMQDNLLDSSNICAATTRLHWTRLKFDVFIDLL